MNNTYHYRKRFLQIFSAFLFVIFIQSNAFNIQSELIPSSSNWIDGSNNILLLEPQSNETKAGYIEWLPAEVLEEDTGFIRDIKIAMDGLNNTHVFWVQKIESNWHLREKIKYTSNNSWAETQSLCYVTDNNEQWVFDVETSKNGSIHLTWEKNENIYYRVFSAPNWGPAKLIAYGRKPKIELNVADKPGIIFTKYEDYQYYWRIHHAYAEFSASDDIWDYIEFGAYYDARDSRHDFTSSLSGGKEWFHGVLSYLSQIYNRIERKYYTNYTLNAVSKSNDSEILYSKIIEDVPLPERSIYWNTEPIILNNKDNNRMYLVVDYLAENGQEVFCFIYNGANWGSRIDLSITSTPDVSVVHKTAAIDPFGGLTTIWSERIFVNSTIETGKLQIKSYKEAFGWSETEYLQDELTYARSPYLEFDAAGDAHLVWWEDFEGERTLYYRFGYGDGDGDGLTSNDEKEIYGTNPYDPDTDDDQMLDGEEISLGFDPFNPDEDTDGMLDGYELHHGLDPYTNDSYLDLDSDLLFNIEEFWEGTLPNNNDTDDDNVSDYQEVKIHFTNPFNEDTDDDEVDDGVEINELGSNPNSNDTDSDGMRDWYEWVYNIKILVNDTTEDPDGDGLWNIYEYEWGINPNKPDHDDDGLIDGDEVLIWGTHPRVRDTDKDNLWDGVEVHTYGTNPLKMDTDDDYLLDWIEIANGIDPLDNDTDDDLLLDGYEYAFGLDPFNSSDAYLDYDNDDLNNFEESLLWTNPYESDTDGDKILDLDELSFGSDPTLYDTDEDGLDDYAELIVLQTNVTNPDTDFDGLLDGLEVHTYYSDPFIQDTDGDTLLDGEEVYIYFTDPTTIHTDDDLLADNLELLFGTNPNLKDTEFDGMDDFWEWQYGLNGTINDAKLDFDNDNVTNIVEYSQGSNPLLVESDGDGISDYDEIFVYFTHPGMIDTDEDGLSDFEELFIYGTIPYDVDTDDDELSDWYEIMIGTDPKNQDTDGDGVSDPKELLEGTDPLEPKSNLLRITLFTFLIVSCVVLSSLALYYSIPWLISKKKSTLELSWMKEGQEVKKKKTDSILEK